MSLTRLRKDDRLDPAVIGVATVKPHPVHDLWAYSSVHPAAWMVASMVRISS